MFNPHHSSKGSLVKKSHRILTRLIVAAAGLTAVAGAQAQGSTSGSATARPMYGFGGGYIGLNAGQSDYSLGNGTGLFGSTNRVTAYSLTGGAYSTKISAWRLDTPISVGSTVPAVTPGPKALT